MKNRKIWAAVLALCLMLAGCTAGTGGESDGEQEGGTVRIGGREPDRE